MNLTSIFAVQRTPDRIFIYINFKLNESIQQKHKHASNM